MTHLELRSGGVLPLSAAASEVQPWPRPARILFALGAAAACWAVPLALLYYFLIR